MAIIIDGKKLSEKIKKELAKKVDILKEQGKRIKLAVILVGEDGASKIYVRNKSKACDEVGIEYEEHILKEQTTMKELLELIKNLNERKDITGILLQSPVPHQLDIQKAFREISPNKDVDGFNPYNIGMLQINQEKFISCTPLGILKMFEEYKIDVSGKNAVIIGRSNIVGKPMTMALLNRNATVTVCHSKTENIKKITQNADILISAVGKEKFITADMVKSGAVVIDVGINRNPNTGKLCGDVDFENVSKKAGFITPVPGGVGPMTIAMLMNNVIKASEDYEENTKHIT